MIEDLVLGLFTVFLGWIVIESSDILKKCPKCEARRPYFEDLTPDWAEFITEGIWHCRKCHHRW